MSDKINVYNKISFNNIINDSNKDSKSFTFKDGLSVFKIFLILLLIVSLMRSFSGLNSITFNSLLNFLSNAPLIDMPFSVFTDLSITGDWGLFEFLRSFLNVFTGLFSVIVFISAGLINCIRFFIYFLQWIFV